jgi:uncharacterized protein (TIGR02246 family)
MTNRNTSLALITFFLFGLAFMTTTATAQTRPATLAREADTTSSADALAAEARRAIDEGNATAMKAWAKSDAAMFVSTFAEDALELRPDGSVVKGRRQILELVKASMQRLGPGVELTVKTTKVWLDGETAYETGKSVYKYTEKGEPKTFETLFVSIWKKQRDGTWKLIADMPVSKE